MLNFPIIKTAEHALTTVEVIAKGINYRKNLAAEREAAASGAKYEIAVKVVSTGCMLIVSHIDRAARREESEHFCNECNARRETVAELRRYGVAFNDRMTDQHFDTLHNSIMSLIQKESR